MLNIKNPFTKPKPKSIAEIAEANRKAYMEMLGVLKWDTLGSEPEMMWAYTDADGHNYYVPRNIWQGISRDRLTAIESASLALERRQSREQLMESLRKVLAQFQRCQNGELEAAHEGYAEAWKVLELARTAPSEQVLMEYAVHLIYTDGENPETISPSLLQIKRERAQNDTALKAFFLDIALSITQASLPISEPVGLDFSGILETEKPKPSKQEASRQKVSNFIAKSEAKRNSSQTATPGS